MAEVLTRGTMLPPQIVEGMFNKVGGHSSLAALGANAPIPFNGTKEFTFTLDKEADIVAENGAKSNGGATVDYVTIIPIKFEYGARVSDEFLYGSEEYRLGVLQSFAEGASKKFARGMDLAGMHGVNPRTGTESDVVGDNCFDKKVTNEVLYVAANADENIDTALSMVEAADGTATGIAMSPTMRSAIAQIKANGMRVYPEFAFGAAPKSLGGMELDVNNTVNGASSKDVAIVGDFANAFKWGYSKEIPLEVIEYGNPDNDAQLGDLKGHNQVYLRAEVYIGWGILAPEYFSRIVTELSA